MNPALATAAFLSAATLVSTALAQAVPAPPPAGVLPNRARVMPIAPQTSAQPKPTIPPAAQSVQPETLPQLPENPIKLEVNEPSPVVEQPAMEQPAGTIVMPEPAVVRQPMEVAAPIHRKPVKPAGPVYYYPSDRHSTAASVMAPPAMHVPNSPFVEDLSVGGVHGRYPYYSYRRPWYTPGQLSSNVTIIW